jgi:glycosyltransferase involved in cell wall biosynthesis
MIQELVRRKHRVLATSPEADESVVKRLKALGAAFQPIPFRRAAVTPLRDIQYLAKLFFLSFTYNPDVVVSFTHKPNIVTGLYSGLRGVGCSHLFMVEGLGYAFLKGSLQRSLVKRVLQFIYKVPGLLSSGAIFLNLEDYRTFLEGSFITRQMPYLVLRGVGVDLTRFGYFPSPKDGFQFLMVARILRSKGVIEYCNAAERVRQAYPKAKFRLVGDLDPGLDGIGAEELDAVARRAGVQLSRFRIDIEQDYRGCNVFVLPSYREGFPVTVMEAMATGRAVIVSDVVGCRDAVRHGVDGILVPARDVAALADAMLFCLRNPAVIEAFGRNGRNAAEKWFDQGLQAAAQADWLERFAERRLAVL